MEGAGEGAAKRRSRGGRGRRGGGNGGGNFGGNGGGGNFGGDMKDDGGAEQGQRKRASDEGAFGEAKRRESSSGAPLRAEGVAPVAPGTVKSEKNPEHKAHLSKELFSALDISANSKRALSEVCKFTFMTVVQAATLPSIMAGKDVLAKAKTGTGKTVGFMLPVIENLLRRKGAGGAMDISCLVISPTRDLAIQTEDEAKMLCTFHGSLVKLGCVVGGLNKNKDLRVFGGALDVLIATPGRLIDHLQTTPGFSQRVARLQCLVLDEADRLLDMGFRPDLERIMNFLPKQRQTLLFSATYPDQLDQVVRFALKPGYSVIDTVGVEEGPQTNTQVTQQSLILPSEFQPHAVWHILQDHMAACKARGRGHKVMVFFPTARIVSFWSQLFTDQAGLRVLEMHSRKSQAQRGKLVDEFRAASNLIMFSSDLTARGLDFEDVTLILQVGLTDREQYIHRLGRTARAGQSGEGLLVLAPWEQRFLNELGDLPIKAADPNLWLAKGPAPQILRGIAAVQTDQELFQAAEKAYVTALGFYVTKMRQLGKSQDELINEANNFSRIIGLTSLPEIEAKTAGKMGLKGCRLINIVKSFSNGGHQGQQQQQHRLPPPGHNQQGGQRQQGAQQQGQHQGQRQHAPGQQRPQGQGQGQGQQQQRPQGGARPSSATGRGGAQAGNAFGGRGGVATSSSQDARFAR